MKQALTLGVTRGRIKTLVKKGALQRVCYGIVRAAGSPNTFEQQLMIGVLVGGAKTLDRTPASAICGETAGFLWDLIERPSEQLIHVVVTRQADPRPGYEFHRTNRLPTAEVARLEGIPVTDPYRTFIDLCDRFPYRAVTILRRGLRKQVLDRNTVLDRINVESRQGRSGLRAAREALERTDPSASKAKSWLEDRFYNLILGAGFPAPERNFKVRGSFGFDWEIDLYDRTRSAGVEVSPTDTHSDPHVQIKDSRKLLDLRNMGIDIIVVTEATTDAEFITAYRRLMDR